MSDPRQTLEVLVVSPDPDVVTELGMALGPHVRGAIHSATTLDEGVDAARYRRPDLLFVEMEAADVERIQRFVGDVKAVASRTEIVVLYGSHSLGQLEGSSLVEVLRSGVRDFIRRPVSTGEISGLIDRLREGQQPTRPTSSEGRLVSFVSNKGGVGKSTIAVNVAVSLARRYPDRVLLVDAALQLGVCGLLLGLNPSTSIVDVARERSRIDETLLLELTAHHSSGLRVLASPADAIEAAELSEQTMTLVLGLARNLFDYVVVDTFPVLDRILVAALDLSDLAFVITQGTVPAVHGASSFLGVLQRLGVPEDRTRVVLSQNHPRITGGLSVSDIEERLGRPVPHFVPFDKRVLLASNAGHPLTAGAGGRFGFGGFRRAIRDIAYEVESVATRDLPTVADEEKIRRASLITPPRSAAEEGS